MDCRVGPAGLLAMTREFYTLRVKGSDPVKKGLSSRGAKRIGDPFQPQPQDLILRSDAQHRVSKDEVVLPCVLVSLVVRDASPTRCSSP